MNLGHVLAPRPGTGNVYPPESVHRELLVHNVSHSDVIVALRVPTEMRAQTGSTGSFTTLPGTDLEPCVLARPKFSSFDYVASTIRERVAAAEHEGSLRDCVMDSEQGARTRVGFSFAGSPIMLRGWMDFHIKGTTAELPEAAYKSAPEVVCVYLPLAAVLIPRWLGVVRSFGTPCALWLYLVSGSGTPHNPDHPVTGNSTVAVSSLIDSFVRRVAPEVTVQRIHSGPGVFRYHDNVTFVNSKLQPVVERHHREMCSTGDEEWHKRIHIKMTLADGATARVTALTHALRRYRPDFFHVWQLKSFWHYQRVDELDVDFIRFSRVDTMPPVLRDSLSADARLLVDEMRSFHASFQGAAANVDDTELAKFWLRKTRKPVLAVLLVQKLPDGEPRLFRGINMEVSMPTGSLCAERNVIGTALSSDLVRCRPNLPLYTPYSMP